MFTIMKMYHIPFVNLGDFISSISRCTSKISYGLMYPSREDKKKNCIILTTYQDPPDPYYIPCHPIVSINFHPQEYSMLLNYFLVVVTVNTYIDLVFLIIYNKLSCLFLLPSMYNTTTM